MRSRFLNAIVLIALTIQFPPNALGDVKLPGVFSDHMVLQMGKEIPFWGWAEPGEEVTVSMTARDSAADVATTTAGSDGRWFAKLQARTKPGAAELKFTGKNVIQISDVLIGDVWLGSGQSNMEWPVKASLNHQEETAEAKYPSIRIFKVERSTARVPQSDVEGKWIECSPETVGDISIVERRT